MKVTVASVFMQLLTFTTSIGEGVGQQRHEPWQTVPPGIPDGSGRSSSSSGRGRRLHSDAHAVRAALRGGGGGFGGRVDEETIEEELNRSGHGRSSSSSSRSRHNTLGRRQDECKNSDIAECVGLLEVLTNKDLGFAASVDELNRMCPVLLNGLQCIDNYTRRCLTPKHREYFNKLYAGTIRVIKDLCNTKGKYQQEYIRHAPCMRQVNPKYNQCSEAYHKKTADLNQINDAVVQLSQEEKNRNVITLCCSFQEYLQCSERVVYETCGNETALFTKAFLDRMAGPIVQDICRNFSLSLHSCLDEASTEAPMDFNEASVPEASTNSTRVASETQSLEKDISENLVEGSLLQEADREPRAPLEESWKPLQQETSRKSREEPHNPHNSRGENEEERAEPSASLTVESQPVVNSRVTHSMLHSLKTLHDEEGPGSPAPLDDDALSLPEKRAEHELPRASGHARLSRPPPRLPDSPSSSSPLPNEHADSSALTASRVAGPPSPPGDRLNPDSALTNANASSVSAPTLGPSGPPESGASGNERNEPRRRRIRHARGRRRLWRRRPSPDRRRVAASGGEGGRIPEGGKAPGPRRPVGRRLRTPGDARRRKPPGNRRPEAGPPAYVTRRHEGVVEEPPAGVGRGLPAEGGPGGNSPRRPLRGRKDRRSRRPFKRGGGPRKGRPAGRGTRHKHRLQGRRVPFRGEPPSGFVWRAPSGAEGRRANGGGSKSGTAADDTPSVAEVESARQEDGAGDAVSITLDRPLQRPNAGTNSTVLLDKGLNGKAEGDFTAIGLAPTPKTHDYSDENATSAHESDPFATRRDDQSTLAHHTPASNTPPPRTPVHGRSPGTATADVHDNRPKGLTHAYGTSTTPVTGTAVHDYDTIPELDGNVVFEGEHHSTSGSDTHFKSSVDGDGRNRKQFVHLAPDSSEDWTTSREGAEKGGKEGEGSQVVATDTREDQLWFRRRIQEELMEAVFPAPTPVPYVLRIRKEQEATQGFLANFTPVVLDILESDFLPILNLDEKSDVTTVLENDVFPGTDTRQETRIDWNPPVTSAGIPVTSATNKVTEPKTEVTTKIAEPKTKVTTKIAEPKTKVTTKIAEPKTKVTTKSTEPKTEVTTKIAEPKTEITTKTAEPKTEVTTKVTEPQTEVTTKITEPKTEVTTKIAKPVTTSTSEPREVTPAVVGEGGLGSPAPLGSDVQVMSPEGAKGAAGHETGVEKGGKTNLPAFTPSESEELVQDRRQSANHSTRSDHERTATISKLVSNQTTAEGVRGQVGGGNSSESSDLADGSQAESVEEVEVEGVLVEDHQSDASCSHSPRLVLVVLTVTSVWAVL